MTQELWDLPTGWQWHALADLVSDGPKNGYSGRVGLGGTPTLKLSATTRGSLVLDDSTTKTLEELIPPYSDAFLRRGDLLIQRANSLPYIGAAAIFDGPEATYVYPDLMMRVRVADASTRRLLWRWLNSDSCRAYFRTHATGTAGNMPKINSSVVRRTRVPLPPPGDRAALADRMDDLLNRGGSARRAIEPIAELLDQLRQSVLAAAFRGDLTAAWRDSHPDVEPASVLLDRIRAERCRRWEAANPRKKYVAPEPVDPNAEELPELPTGWVWTRLREIADIVGGITKGQKRKGGAPLRSVPYLRVANVQRGHIDLSEVTTIPATPAEIEALHLQPGDILFNEGGDRDKLGRGWVWEGQIAECIHQNHVFRGRLFSSSVEARLVSWWGNTFGRRYFFAEGQQTVNLASISITRLGGLPVPLAPAAEQRALRNVVEDGLARVERLDALAGSLDGLTRSLASSLLAAAFRGNLVPGPNQPNSRADPDSRVPRLGTKTLREEHA